MIVREGDTPPRVRGLDSLSRRVLARFGFELAWFAAIAFAPALAGTTPTANAAMALGTYCSFAALLRVFIAARRRDRAFAGSLNSWDECLALSAAAMLAYAAGRMLA